MSKDQKTTITTTSLSLYFLPLPMVTWKVWLTSGLALPNWPSTVDRASAWVTRTNKVVKYAYYYYYYYY